MLIAIPLLLIPVILYNIVVLFGAPGDMGMAQADAILRDPMFSIPMASGAQWNIGSGDLILFLGLILLFFELIKSTSSQKVAIVNHALSMVLFIVVLVEFLLIRGFATSTFFLIVVMILLDVLAGFIVTIISSRKDFDLGN
ncbi:MAG: hypothetical protein KJ728_12925 [Alphaproteobacteria bacterium]|jgi:hypothetical protein|uniref:Uncharacterized protein n=1 Tax=Brevundimonas mediterranea TaxID=74329 RepID=A0A6G7EHJ0_9CAUL|nr:MULTISPECIES: hypothetical protein [Brevundimonas]MBU1270975.1 hypothetical protein [Alphaproteobacteria bacterium]OGN47274.1 MAG: hypothetical protein A2795_13350 [Caulobacterales bacterium RIFCSPHIGHO2_01_FULL_67_30]EDX79081.1 hypothetical protein BBAL3_238 [Brevundimonas sp. BAL3]KDP93329.1 membrane protein [Brevundimonas sp. EAKA]MBA4330829.1 hypothetical protein [Brevundimonas sp.]